MKLILIRHGETLESKKGILLGWLPGNLSTKGKKEIPAIAKEIKVLKPEIIVSSDLKRTKDSAKIIAKSLRIKVIYNELLRERKGGIAEGKKENEINWETYEKISFPYRKHQGGESFFEVKKRAKEFLQSIRNQKYKTVVIVSHNVVLAMILAHLKHWSMKKALKTDFSKAIVVNIK